MTLTKAARKRLAWFLALLPILLLLNLVIQAVLWLLASDGHLGARYWIMCLSLAALMANVISMRWYPEWVVQEWESEGCQASSSGP